MKKTIAFLILALYFFPVSAQIEATKVGNGENRSDLKDIILVFKMHVDIGYTDWAESVLQNYTTSMIKETLQSIDSTNTLPKEEQFVWTIPSWPLQYILDNTSASNRAKTKEAIQQDRLKVHALPFTFQTESSDLETLVRSMSFSSNINRQFEQPLVRGAKLTDVPSHSWVLPTLLTQAGVKILHIGCNSGSTSPDLPTLFWWEGPDGSRLLTFNWAEYYGSGVLPPANWKHKTWLAMIHTHENTGAPSPKDVVKVLKEAREKAPEARIRIGELEDFYDALILENPDLPVIKGDMPDTWIHGYMSMPKETKINKMMQRLIYNTETLNKQLANWGVDSDTLDHYISKAVEQSLLFDEHTFGLALSHGNQGSWKYEDQFIIDRAKGEYDYIEGSWYQKGSRIHNAQQQILPSLRKELKKLAGSVQLDGQKVVVYNPLPWLRSGMVSFHMSVYKKDFQVYGLKDESTGKIFPAKNDSNHLSFYGEDIPSLGYKTYTLLTSPIIDKSSKSMIDKENAILENEFFRLAINPSNGSLLSVWDKKQNREMADKSSPYGFGEYIHEKYGQEDFDRYNTAYVKNGHHGWADEEMARPTNNDLSYQLIKGTSTKIVYEQAAQAISATSFCKTSQGDEYTLTYTLCDNTPYVEIIWGIRNKPAEPQPEGGWLAFPFNVTNPTFHLGRTGAVVNPTTDFIKNTNHDYFFLNTGMAIVDNTEKGFGLNTPNAPGVSLDRTGLYRFSKEFSPKQPNVFVNLFNNQWGTNFTEWIEGGFSSKIYLWSIDKYNNESSLITPTEETRVPLMGAYTNNKGGQLPISAKGIELSRKGVLVTAFGSNIDGEGDVLRIWEQAGEKGKCTITFPHDNYLKAQPCNLRGEPNGNPLIIKNRIISVDLDAYSPLSLILSEK